MKSFLYILWAMAWMFTTAWAVVSAAEKGTFTEALMLAFSALLGYLSAKGVEALADDLLL